MDPRNHDYQEDESPMKISLLNNRLGPCRAMFCEQQGGEAKAQCSMQGAGLWKPAHYSLHEHSATGMSSQGDL